MARLVLAFLAAFFAADRVTHLPASVHRETVVFVK
jgi:hypothetical protein